MRYDDEDADENFDEDDEDNGYIPCPHCGELMLEAADYCPYCDRWATGTTTSKPAQPVWIIVGIALCLGTVLTWVLIGF